MKKLVFRKNAPHIIATILPSTVIVLGVIFAINTSTLNIPTTPTTKLPLNIPQKTFNVTTKNRITIRASKVLGITNNTVSPSIYSSIIPKETATISPSLTNRNKTINDYPIKTFSASTQKTVSPTINKTSPTPSIYNTITTTAITASITPTPVETSTVNSINTPTYTPVSTPMPTPTITPTPTVISTPSPTLLTQPLTITITFNGNITTITSFPYSQTFNISFGESGNLSIRGNTYFCYNVYGTFNSSSGCSQNYSTYFNAYSGTAYWTVEITELIG